MGTQGERIAELVWQRKAAELRTEIGNKLAALGEFEFYPQNKSAEIGTRFWTLLDGAEYAQQSDLPTIFEALRTFPQDQPVIWLHRYTNDAGVIVAPLGAVLSMVSKESFPLGPDILLAEPGFRFGLCFERGEHEAHLRFWGLNAPPK